MVSPLELLFNHLVLPPRLPDSEDKNIEALERTIIERLQHACDALAESNEQTAGLVWQQVGASLSACSELNRGSLDKHTLIERFGSLGRGSYLILYVVKQNAGLIIRRSVGENDVVVFEAFEASAVSECVLAAEGAMNWGFPGRAAEISYSDFMNSSFQRNLAIRLEQASIEILDQFSARATKAGVSVSENRDTTDPGLITQWLMPIIEAAGCPTKTPELKKRVRDDVNIGNSALPWRRLPFWLVVRVGIQRQLCLEHGFDVGRGFYKLLIVTLLSHFMIDCQGELAPDLCCMLQSKVARRMAKLEVEQTATRNLSASYAECFAFVAQLTSTVLQASKAWIEMAYQRFKKENTRIIPLLPRTASPNSFRLSLEVSGEYLKRIIRQAYYPRVQRPFSIESAPNLKDGMSKKIMEQAKTIYKICDSEDKIFANFTASESPQLKESVCQSKCCDIAATMEEYIVEIGRTYDQNPEQMSISILHRFGLWVQMDRYAISCCPVLAHYATPFNPECLDVLQLSLPSYMQRLLDVQRYLGDRNLKARNQWTIFDKLDHDESFASYYATLSAPMQNLKTEIKRQSEIAKNHAEENWKKFCDKYDELTEKQAAEKCQCFEDDDGEIDISRCKKCLYVRQRRRLELYAHEDFLPESEAMQNVIVFELLIPRFFKVYRETSWKLLLLGNSTPLPGDSPHVTLASSHLREFVKSGEGSIRLASATKAFSRTHYKRLTSKVALSEVVRPLGLRFRYYDKASSIWLDDGPTTAHFHHLCGFSVPKPLQSLFEFATLKSPRGICPRSSYEIIASQTKCPRQLPIFEFTALQKLMSGSHLVWIDILRELGSCNLNLGDEETVNLISSLCIQAGPSNKTWHRSTHAEFKNVQFCKQLAEQIHFRLKDITSNWREANLMELLITLSIRLFSLSSGASRYEALKLLETARLATLQWISALTKELRHVSDSNAAEVATNYGLRAALLCRWTFASFVTCPDEEIGSEDICAFVRASLALREASVVDPLRHPPSMKAMILRDTKMVYQLRPKITKTLSDNTKSLNHVFNEYWGDSNNTLNRSYDNWIFLADGNWIATTISMNTEGSLHTQALQYDFLEGHLLVDGTPLESLPSAIQNSRDVRELFGDQHLLTFPSALPGMTHQLHTQIDGQRVHFGIQDKRIVIKTHSPAGLRQFVPRSVFTSATGFDLPSELTEDCIHWLDLQHKCIEIRRRPSIWANRINDWKIWLSLKGDFLTGTAVRKNVNLVSPHSELCKLIGGIFGKFESIRNMTVYQPGRGPLFVTLKHLELSFHVSCNGLLQCKEQPMEIDINQDAGTFYGLQSMVVMREVANPRRRSVFVSMGAPKVSRYKYHVHVQTNLNNKRYGKFDIDEDLRRLYCLPDPEILLTKALLHALTALPVPDSLTRRTGTEEAFHLLQSAQCQPWSSLQGNAMKILKFMQQLGPLREYYPSDKRRMQRTVWKSEMTTFIQHDDFDPIVEGIIKLSNQIAGFEGNSHGITNAKPMSQKLVHLRRRGALRRNLYARHGNGPSLPTSCKSYIYNSRDRHLTMNQATMVHEAVESVLSSSIVTEISVPLHLILEGWESFGGSGYQSQMFKHSLVDAINADIADQWSLLVDFSQKADKWEMVFMLTPLLLRLKPEKRLQTIVKYFIAFHRLPDLRGLILPIQVSFSKFKLDEAPKLSSLLGLIENEYPAFKKTKKPGKGANEMTEDEHDMTCVAEGKRFAHFILDQWPAMPPEVSELQLTHLDKSALLQSIMPEWKRLIANRQLSDFIKTAQDIVDVSLTATYDYDSCESEESWTPDLGLYPKSFSTAVVSILAKDLLSKAGPPSHVVDVVVSRVKDRSQEDDIIGHSKPEHYLRARQIPPETHELSSLLKKFLVGSNELEKRYGEDLRGSLEALKRSYGHSTSSIRSPTLACIVENIQITRAATQELFLRIEQALLADDYRVRWLSLGNLLPIITPVTILEHLRSLERCDFGPNMKESIVSFALLLTSLQRYFRIEQALLKRDESTIRQEIENTGHENWDPAEFIDWLLLEVDNNILIRREQVEVAKFIISPTTKVNSLLQMNMGKGKTSCIMPMAAAILADKVNLCRLIIPNALLNSTAEILQSKLGGLVGRSIRHIPFSRRISTKNTIVQLYHQLHREILSTGGVIVTTLESILSFELSGKQCLLDQRKEEGREMIQSHEWLKIVSRDILDESDATLAVRTQLIYPSGSQLPVDGQSDRWTIPEFLLSLVEEHLPELQKMFPRSIEVVYRGQGFPLVHFLQSDVEDSLCDLLMQDICAGRLPLIRKLLSSDIMSTSSNISESEAMTFDVATEIRKLLAAPKFDAEVLGRLLEVSPNDKYAIEANLLILRGLIREGILIVCLKKRWSVQYGLHLDRQPMAVPFEARGVPSERAEFGHPDVAIMLTCLSFYYSGLNLEQLSKGLKLVLRSDNPASEYERWISSATLLPSALRHWNIINVDDQSQVRQLWNFLRYNRFVVNHYINNFVFPFHAKQFPVKLQASGWDLPLFAQDDFPHARTTGFSGTNDNKYLLPLTIQQDDLPGLQQTSAEVLTYLLQDRNRYFEVAASDGKRFTERQLLLRLNRKNIRLLIDAGAYVLEMTNEDLVKIWLEVDTNAKAAVYFDDRNKAWVRYRGRKDPIPLIATPFTNDLTECVVYLDQAHTRGVDLKFKTDAIGAVTLALGQTKDHTVQAVMRLRQLATSQSITFFAPPEVDQSIQDICGLDPGTKVDSAHVIYWLLHQTCRANAQLQPLHAAQGTDFCIRKNAEWRFASNFNDLKQLTTYISVVRQSERQSLREFYGYHVSPPHVLTDDISFQTLQNFIEIIDDRKHENGIDNQQMQSTAFEEVEQEREVEFQVEEVREVQRPRHYPALSFGGVHSAIHGFVRDGILSGGHGYAQAFETLRDTKIGVKYDVLRTYSRLFVSEEFTRTVDLSNDKKQAEGINDGFLRPVEWILWSPAAETALILIPEEVEALISTIRKSMKPKVWLIVYSAPVTRRMSSFSKLNYYMLPYQIPDFAVPEWLLTDLAIFAGNAYLDYNECRTLSRYIKGASAMGWSHDLESWKAASPYLTLKPADFLVEWLALRRCGQDISHTPLGYLCDGRTLAASHHFFVEPNSMETVVPSIPRGGDQGMASTDDEEDDEEELEDEELEVSDVEGEKTLD